jgi:membrane protein implicated in regulation of membrane protease activity
MGLSKLIFVLVVAVVGWMVYNKFVADAKKLSRRNEERRKATANGASGTLVQDPVTGEYHLKRNDEE